MIPVTPTPPTKGTPAADVRRYFPDVATIHGSRATDANALQQLAVWLLHWAERPKGKRYSLPGQMREQQEAYLHAGKFLKACRRLHEALLPLAADEPDVKQLLGNEYGPHSRTNLAAVLKWWAGWIKEQQFAHDDPAGAYLAALRRVPVVEEWENGSPRYNLPTHLGTYDEFEAEITPLRQAFEAVLPDLPTKKKQALRAGLNELLSIDQAGVQRRREQFDRGEYGLNFLLADYPSLRFDVAGQPGGFKWQWVSPLFWSGLSILLQYKQGAARAAFEQLAALLEATRPVEVPATPLLTPAATRILYLKLLEHPALVGELTAYQKSELRAYAKAEQLSATRLAVELMDGNPNYNYPAGYLNGREVEYWQGTISSYADSERALRLLALPAPASLPAPPATVAASELADNENSKLSLRQVALLHVYQYKIIPKAADEVARHYGHNSGAKLYEYFRTVSQRAGRIGEDITGQKLVPMIKDIAAVIPHLNSPARQQAESERQTLEARKDKK